MTLSAVPSFSTKCPFHVFVAGGVAGAAVILSMWIIAKRGKAIRRYDVDHRFTDVACYNGLVFISGQVGEGDTIEKQTISALKCVDDALKKGGTDKSKILECTIWLSSMKYYDGMNAVYDKWIIPGKPPCRACIGAILGSPNYMVEVRVIAAQ